MKSHTYDGPSFGPEALKAMGQAFDEAWAAIAGNFSADEVELARSRLAKAVLSVTCEDSVDAEVLQRGAIAEIARRFTGQ